VIIKHTVIYSILYEVVLDVCWFTSEERQRQQQLQSQLEHQNKMELQRQEQQILQSEELLRHQMVCIFQLPRVTTYLENWENRGIQSESGIYLGIKQINEYVCKKPVVNFCLGHVAVVHLALFSW